MSGSLVRFRLGPSMHDLLLSSLGCRPWTLDPGFPAGMTGEMPQRRCYLLFRHPARIGGIQLSSPLPRKSSTKRSRNFLTCHFERSEKSSASKILRMHKISPSGRDDVFFIYVMKFWFRLGRVRDGKKQSFISRSALRMDQVLQNVDFTDTESCFCRSGAKPRWHAPISARMIPAPFLPAPNECGPVWRYR
uniref:Uncharacterized protein n=1 Tax=Candidatus Kentrum sp. UNK TaxID=2126344 RepID=A0A451AIG1_9GAMM|nr:MAG: hypothetical protein BECKUNK1418G_GA0071005_107015 [Candidatus Kentron sp. UNK]VFK70237.1 MAG: hypothetical protein BECKUNK1418H_GA0071006_102515 [Candidatus Kentron sp. UNK]